jgi:predicted ABC-type ATPase
MSTGGRKIVIIAGPNGAGKTTFAREFLPKEASCPVFVNADLIAAALQPDGAIFTIFIATASITGSGSTTAAIPPS